MIRVEVILSHNPTPSVERRDSDRSCTLQLFGDTKEESVEEMEDLRGYLR